MLEAEDLEQIRGRSVGRRRLEADADLGGAQEPAVRLVRVPQNPSTGSHQLPRRQAPGEGALRDSGRDRIRLRERPAPVSGEPPQQAVDLVSVVHETRQHDRGAPGCDPAHTPRFYYALHATRVAAGAQQNREGFSLAAAPLVHWLEDGVVHELRGHLLIANGGLFDPNFRQTVVLVCKSDDEGTLGVVLNRVSEVTVAEAAPVLAQAAEDGAHLFLGGPVQPQSAVILADLEHPDLAELPILGSIGLLSGEVTEDVVAGIRRGRVYAGYAGWGAGQLESEIERGDWIVEPARRDDIFTDDPAHLWNVLLRRKGGTHALLAMMPFDPSTN